MPEAEGIEPSALRVRAQHLAAEISASALSFIMISFALFYCKSTDRLFLVCILGRYLNKTRNNQ